MASLQKLDKKQLPQVIGLGVASCGLFGYFAFKMIAPTASAAPPPAKQPPTAPVPVAGGTSNAAGGDSAASSAPVADAPAPTASMRNPFVPEVPLTPTPGAPGTTPPVSPPTPPAKAPASLGGPVTASVPPAGLGPLPSVPVSAGPLPAVPGTPKAVGAVTDAAAPPAAPPWTVTGVLQSGRSQVAILRNGDERDYSRLGDMVDANFRVTDITRSFVELRHGSRTYTLPLGGPKTAPAKPGTAADSTGVQPSSTGVQPGSVTSTRGKTDADTMTPAGGDDIQNGDALMQDGRYADAIQQYTKATEDAPGLMAAELKLANAEYKNGEFDDARTGWETVADGGDPKDAVLAQDFLQKMTSAAK